MGSSDSVAGAWKCGAAIDDENYSNRLRREALSSQESLIEREKGQ